ncbi:MAG TPA: Arc family DNA binding domain-containing protein [Devosia sp.]|nr:Arc family DNA binding domain-containing protein [Devosia sp.]
MPQKPRKSYPLRIHEDILTAMTRWSEDELRSLNGQIEYVLRDALRRANRLKEQTPKVTVAPPQEPGRKSRK